MGSVRITVVMPLGNLKGFLAGEKAWAWITHSNHDPDMKVFGTMVEVDAKDVDFEREPNGGITLKLKDGQKA